MSAELVELLARLGPGSAVACDLRCPNWRCRDEPVIHGSAEVVNGFGVRDLLPQRCSRCGVLLRVARFIDLDAGAARVAGGETT